MASLRPVKPVHQLSGALAADARMSHRDMQILAPKVRVPHRTRPLATNLKPLRKHIGGTSADGTGARMRPLPIKVIDCFDHPVQLGSVHRGPGAWTAATDRSPARAGLHRSRFDILSADAADATGVHIVYAARLPSGQGKVFVRSSPDGQRVNAGHHA